MARPPPKRTGSLRTIRLRIRRLRGGTDVLVRWFSEISAEHGPIVGGKAASLGEMYQNLDGKGVRVPNGFATTAHAYASFLDASVSPESWDDVTSHESLGPEASKALQSPTLRAALEMLFRDAHLDDDVGDARPGRVGAGPGEGHARA